MSCNRYLLCEAFKQTNVSKFKLHTRCTLLVSSGNCANIN